MFLYGVTLWLVVGSLAAIQIRHEVKEDDANITFADVERSYNNYRNAADALYADLNDGAGLYGRYPDLYLAIETKVVEIQRMAVPDSPMPASEFEVSADFESVAGECIDAGFSSSIAICGPMEDYYDLQAELAALDAEVESANFDALYADVMRKVVELREREPLNRHFDTLEFFSFMPLYSEFLKEPLHILVLQLTMVMGMLGSVISMTWSFIKKDSGFTFRRFLILPFVGAMSAFIIFVFVKAGQLTLTAGGATEPLNPFVLSFVGIISGLLSELAYSRMSEIGSGFFKADEETPRYGLGLRAALEESGVDQQALASYLKLSDDETAAIVDGRSAAGPLHQQLVAACLRRSVRELFTDLPPDAPVAAVAPVAGDARPA